MEVYLECMLSVLFTATTNTTVHLSKKIYVTRRRRRERMGNGFSAGDIGQFLTGDPLFKKNWDTYRQANPGFEGFLEAIQQFFTDFFYVFIWTGVTAIGIISFYLVGELKYIL